MSSGGICSKVTKDTLPLQVIYVGTTPRCHPHFQFPSDWDITHSKKHCSTEKTMVQYIENIIVPYVKHQRESLGLPECAALVVIDNFKSQIATKINSLLENNIDVCLFPPNATDVLQPMDLSVNKPAKAFLSNKFEH